MHRYSDGLKIKGKRREIVKEGLGGKGRRYKTGSLPRDSNKQRTMKLRDMRKQSRSTTQKRLLESKNGLLRKSRLGVIHVCDIFGRQHAKGLDLQYNAAILHASLIHEVKLMDYLQRYWMQEKN